MAFVSATGLRAHNQASVNTNRLRLCKVDRVKTNRAATIKMEDSIPPLNASEEHAMKEMYSLAASKKAPVCRCWQSKKFPLCDGSHNAFNKETGSHVGPLVVSVAKDEE